MLPRRWSRAGRCELPTRILHRGRSGNVRLFPGSLSRRNKCHRLAARRAVCTFFLALEARHTRLLGVERRSKVRVRYALVHGRAAVPVTRPPALTRNVPVWALALRADQRVLRLVA